MINNTINDSVTFKQCILIIKWRARNHKYHFKFTRSHTNIMKHEHVVYKRTKPRKDRVLLLNYFCKIETLNLDGQLCAQLLCTIALILECINVTLNERCNHQNNQTTVSLRKTIPKLLPVHSEINIPKDLCAERKEFPLRASNNRVNVCTYHLSLIKGFYFTSRKFISFNGMLEIVQKLSFRVAII